MSRFVGFVQAFTGRRVWRSGTLHSPLVVEARGTSGGLQISASTPQHNYLDEVFVVSAIGCARTPMTRQLGASWNMDVSTSEICRLTPTQMQRLTSGHAKLVFFEEGSNE